MWRLLLLFVGTFAFGRDYSNYQLIFEDNFDGSSLDTSKWSIVYGEGVWNTGGNCELEVYVEDSTTFEDSCLVMEAKKETVARYHFTSSRLMTYGHFKFSHGWIESRIKLPEMKTKGLWPAFWMLGDSPPIWPKCGEIDIMEAGNAGFITNGTISNSFASSLHFYNDTGNYHQCITDSYYSSTTLDDNFHLYQVYWDQNYLKMFVDDAEDPFYTFSIHDSVMSELWDNQMYILLNVAVGGVFTGCYEESCIDSTFPAKMYVDYIRVYQDPSQLAYTEDYASNYFGVLNCQYPEVNKVAAWDNAPNSAHTYPWNSITHLATNETSGGLTMTALGTGWIGFGIQRGEYGVFDLSKYKEGALVLDIMTTFTGEITLGIITKDSEGTEIKTQISADFPRTGEWSTLTMPLSSTTPTPQLQNLTAFFFIVVQEPDLIMKIHLNHIYFVSDTHHIKPNQNLQESLKEIK